MDDCGLCTSIYPENRHKQVHIGKVAYVMIPWEPLKEGHVLVLPQRHVRMEDLTIPELAELRDLTILMKERLLHLFPTAPPYLLSAMDTPYAAIPDHFHYHLFPLEHHIRTALAPYNPTFGERRRVSPSELEKMAHYLGGPPSGAIP